MNELSCWYVDWTAIAAVVTAIAVMVALWVGLEPRRMEAKRQKQRAIVAAGLLGLELRAALITGQKLSNPQECEDLQKNPKHQEYALGTLAMPLFKTCAAEAETYPYTVSVLMANACAATSGLQLSISMMNQRQTLSAEQISRMQSMAKAVATTCGELEQELRSYLPAEKRSVSNTPSGTSESMLNK